MQRPVIAVAVMGLVLLALAALDDITTGAEPNFYYEYAMLVVSFPLLVWLARRHLSATGTKQSPH